MFLLTAESKIAWTKIKTEDTHDFRNQEFYFLSILSFQILYASCHRTILWFSISEVSKHSRKKAFMLGHTIKSFSSFEQCCFLNMHGLIEYQRNSSTLVLWFLISFIINILSTNCIFRIISENIVLALLKVEPRGNRNINCVVHKFRLCKVGFYFLHGWSCPVL